MEYNFDIEKLMPIIEEYASKAKFVLEIGPAKGNGSTIAIERGLERSPNRHKMFVSVDIRDYMEYKPKLDYWFFVLGDSRSKDTVWDVSNLCFRGEIPDLIFIDTVHTYEQMKVELETWWEASTLETTWLFHDTWMMGEYNHMTDAIKEFAEEHGLVYEDVTTDSHGLGAMHK